MKKLFFSLLMFVGAVGLTSAQEVQSQTSSKDQVVPVSHWSVGVKGGGSYFRTGPTAADRIAWKGGVLDMTSLIGGTIEYTINPFIGIGGEGSFIGYSRNNKDGSKLIGHTKDALLYASFNLSNILSPDRIGTSSKINVYANIGAGMGLYSYAIDAFNVSGSNKSTFLGMGGVNVEYNLNKFLALGLEGQYRYYGKDDLGHFPTPKGFSDALAATIGLRYKFNSSTDAAKKHVRNINKNELIPADSDKDGVNDLADKCGNTPEGVKVDAFGCPVDTDGDGVADYLDKCPGTAADASGKVDANGCPIDTDGDGVADYLDKCPGTAVDARGKVDLNGCAIDTDADGVADYLDKCPGTPKEARGMVDKKGCPLDTDADGILDYLDKCPKLAGVIANNGCPEVKKEVKTLFKKALQGIQFQTGKATIKPTSFAILNQIANTLNLNPSYLIEVQGHTDNVGKPEANMILSQERADAVLKYLLSKKVSEKQITSKGYGDTKPVADNTTAAGKAKNRRVEFVISFEK